MRGSKQCPKCKSLEIGYLDYQPDEDGTLDVAARHLGLAAHEVDGLARRVGEMCAFVCMSCGFYESYVKDPGSVPWNEIASFHPINPEAAESGPYR